MSTKSNQITDVIFRRWRNGNIIALFPREPGTNSPYTCGSYEHIGQHGAATPDHVVSLTTPAKPEEYAALKLELESAPYEYRLRVIKRLAYGMIDDRRNAIAAE